MVPLTQRTEIKMTKTSPTIPSTQHGFPSPLNSHVGEDSAREAGWSFSYVYDFMKLLEESEQVSMELAQMSEDEKAGAKRLRERLGRISERMVKKNDELRLAHKQWKRYRESLRN